MKSCEGRNHRPPHACCSSPAARCAIHFLRNQLFRDKEVISDVWLQSGKPGISQEANEVLQKFPETEDELFDYDCIVAFDPDWEQLDAGDVKNLERWVAEKAGGLVIVTGPVFTPQWSSRLRGDPRIDTLKALIRSCSMQNITLSWGSSEKVMAAQFSRDGLEAEFLWLTTTSHASRRRQFDGVSGYYAVKDPKAPASIPVLAIRNCDRQLAADLHGRAVLRVRPRVLSGQRRNVARAGRR
jgi:hypothetical protein